MTGVYFDTGVLAKLYCTESNSRQAAALVTSYPAPLPFTHWQEIEVRTALRVKAFRKELSAAELAQAMRNLQADMEAGLFARPPCDLPAVFRTAEDLSARFAASAGCRTLDILHVATAITVGSREFVTFDRRQHTLAQQAGLIVHP